MLRDQARSVPPDFGSAIAGINGDFYIRDMPNFAGDPRGLQLLNGELISGPSNLCVWFDPNGAPHLDEIKSEFAVTWPDAQKTVFGLNEQRKNDMVVLYTPTYGPSTHVNGGRNLVLEKEGQSPWLPLRPGEIYHARVATITTNGNAQIPPNSMLLSIGPAVRNLPEVKPGATLQISTATVPDLKGIKVALGGGPGLLHKGTAFPKVAPPGVSKEWSQRSKYERNPRTAMGWSDTHVFFVVVDGRQANLSVGMTLGELAEYFKKLGCTEALNLDGGKSAQMWVQGRIRNSPCQGEDTVANSIFVVKKTASQ
jgi:hypothetical protein